MWGEKERAGDVPARSPSSLFCGGGSGLKGGQLGDVDRVALQIVPEKGRLPPDEPLQVGGSCFVTQAPLSVDEASASTRRKVAEIRAEAEMLLKRRLERAVRDGELPAGTSAADLARFYSVTVQGLALQAQHGGTREELLRVVDLTMALWPKK